MFFVPLFCNLHTDIGEVRNKVYYVRLFYDSELDSARDGWLCVCLQGSATCIAAAVASCACRRPARRCACAPSASIWRPTRRPASRVRQHTTYRAGLRKCGALDKTFCSGPLQWRRRDLGLVGASAGWTKGAGGEGAGGGG